jgi:SNF family Na+-dependent transporter
VFGACSVLLCSIISLVLLRPVVILHTSSWGRGCHVLLCSIISLVLLRPVVTLHRNLIFLGLWLSCGWILIVGVLVLCCCIFVLMFLSLIKAAQAFQTCSRHQCHVAIIHKVSSREVITIMLVICGSY